MRLASAVWLALAAASLGGCGAGAPPAESEIWHAATLRPGVELATTPGEEQLLAQLARLAPDASVELSGERFTAGAPYTAASGRTCRRVRVERDATVRTRLACDDGEGRWTFVPNPFPSEGS